MKYSQIGADLVTALATLPPHVRLFIMRETDSSSLDPYYRVGVIDGARTFSLSGPDIVQLLNALMRSERRRAKVRDV